MDQGLKGGAVRFRERAGGALWRLRRGGRADSRGFRRFFLVGSLQASFETASSAQRSCRTEVFPLVQASSTLISCTPPPSDWFCQDDWALASLGLRAAMPGADGAPTISVPELQGCSADSAPSLTLSPAASDGPFPCRASSEAGSRVQTKNQE